VWFFPEIPDVFVGVHADQPRYVGILQPAEWSASILRVVARRPWFVRQERTDARCRTPAVVTFHAELRKRLRERLAQSLLIEDSRGRALRIARICIFADRQHR